jgi:transposase
MDTILPAADAEKTSSGLLFALGEPLPSSRAEPDAMPKPRLRLAERSQGEFRIAALDELLPPDHQVRVVWDYVCALDLSALLKIIRAVPGQPGRDATDPRILLALWLFATIDGVGSARTLDALCRIHLAYQWLCGGVSLNYHTLADFRGQHTDILDQLLTDSVATMLHEKLITLKQVAQDSMRVRASAGASSFRREPSLQKCLAEAKAQVQALKNQVDEDSQAASRRQQAAQERAARERQERIEQALREREKLVDKREQQQREKGLKFDPAQLRTSTTDPEAARMKMPDGGTRPAYNVQFATTVEGGAIVGVDVSTSGSDGGQMQPMLEQIEKRHQEKPQQMLVDGGFTTLDDIEKAEQAGINVLGPIKNEKAMKAKGEDPYQPKTKDGPGVATWRQRMGTEAAKELYKQRAATAEWANAGARQRGMYQVTVRGRQKVLAVALLQALVHNLLRTVALRQAKKGAG